MDPILAEIAKSSPFAVLLILAIIYLVRRDTRMQGEDRIRTDIAIKSQGDACERREQANRESCERRELDMANRIRHLEDKRHDESAALLMRTVVALETMTKVAQTLAENDTGVHEALHHDGKHR